MYCFNSSFFTRTQCTEEIIVSRLQDLPSPLQANLALSPTALLPSPKSPEVKLQPAPLSPTTPCSPLSPTLRPSHQSSEEEDAVSFNNPPEGTPLPSFNKVNIRNADFHSDTVSPKSLSSESFGDKQELLSH